MVQVNNRRARAALVGVALLIMVPACGDDRDAEDPVTCAANESPISARRYRAGRDCLAPQPETLGCVAIGTMCPQLQTYAEDRRGRCYFFNNLCLPEGFVRSNCGGTRPDTCSDV